MKRESIDSEKSWTRSFSKASFAEDQEITNEVSQDVENKEGGRCATVLQFALCVIIVIVAFFAMGLILYYFGDQKVGQDPGDLNSNPEPPANGSCPPLTRVLINNDVCDEVANVEACEYDAGDCCFPESRKKGDNVKFCSDCKCRLKINAVKHEELLEADNVTMVDFDERQMFFFDVIESYPEVDSTEVCMQLCIDLQINFKAWLYNYHSLMCRCLATQTSHVCMNKLIQLDKDSAYGSLLFLKESQTILSYDCQDGAVIFGGRSSGKHALLASLESPDVGATNNVCNLTDVKMESKLWGATGGVLFNGIPILCGGLDYILNTFGSGFYQSSDDCFNVAIPSQRSKMLQRRMRPSSIVTGDLDDTLFIVGGLDMNLPTISTEFLVLKPGRFDHVEGPELPDVVGDSCFTKLNDSFAFLLMGMGEDSYDIPWHIDDFIGLYYHIDKMQWERGQRPAFLFSSRPTCAAVRDKDTGQMLVIVLGQIMVASHTGDIGVQIWDQESEQWLQQQQRHLLWPVDQPSLLLNLAGNYELFILGGDKYSTEWTPTTDIVKLECHSQNCSMTNERTSLTDYRKYAVALWIPIQHWYNCSENNVDPLDYNATSGQFEGTSRCGYLFNNKKCEHAIDCCCSKSGFCGSSYDHCVRHVQSYDGSLCFNDYLN